MIKITKLSDDIYEVKVKKISTTQHKVRLSNKVYKKLTGLKITEIELIKSSFEFLLERESNQSILREFNLEIIESYFPEYPSLIKNYFD